MTHNQLVSLVAWISVSVYVAACDTNITSGLSATALAAIQTFCMPFLVSNRATVGSVVASQHSKQSAAGKDTQTAGELLGLVMFSWIMVR